MLETIQSAFTKFYGTTPDYIVRSPGRINLIGEHTDYNEGFVFPMAIRYAQWLAIRRNDGDMVNLHSEDIQTTDAFSVRDFSVKRNGWIRYPQGIAWGLTAAGHDLSGWDGLLMGDLPLGAGLSSSAALDLVICKAFSLVDGIPWNPQEMAVISKKSDNQWVGINCGIMDQLVSAKGEKGKALLIDCRSLETANYSLPGETVIIVMDSMAKHSLVNSEYNVRHAQCMAGAQHFGKAFLRDVSLEEFKERSGELEEVIRRRCQHVLTENVRTLEAAKCMERNDPARLGQLMNESHTSLRDDFEVSCEELDILAAEAQRQPGCFGARMTGGGFGGSAIALVTQEQAEPFMQNMARIYEQRTGIKPNIFATDAAQGTSLEFAAGA